MIVTDWADAPLTYALIADPKHKIVCVDHILDDSTIIMVGSWNQCDMALTEIIAAYYASKVDRFEADYDAHIEAMSCGD
jgi:hypothetical protein